MVRCNSQPIDVQSRRGRVLLGAFLSGLLFATVTRAEDADYLRTITQRAEKIVAVLHITDTGRSNRVHGLLVQQYRDLNEIHSARDAEIAAAKTKFTDDKSGANSAVESARTTAKARTDKLHGEFLARLSTELSPEQVDQVKDGMTYNVAPLRYADYLKMFPDLKPEEKRQIKLWLVEAREIAMDGSTSNEKHAVFGKYKGRINNYLSRAGYDLKQGEANLRKPAPSNPETKSK